MCSLRIRRIRTVILLHISKHLLHWGKSKKRLSVKNDMLKQSTFMYKHSLTYSNGSHKRVQDDLRRNYALKNPRSRWMLTTLFFTANRWAKNLSFDAGFYNSSCNTSIRAFTILNVLRITKWWKDYHPRMGLENNVRFIVSGIFEFCQKAIKKI